jgi:hypothetical protein
MTHSKEAAIATKLFIGYPLTAELRLHLSNSEEWKQSQVMQQNSDTIQEIHHKEKNYIGIFLKIEKPSLEDLETTKSQLTTRIEGYSSEIDLRKQSIIIFPQIFLA